VACDAVVRGGGGVGMVYITDPARRHELKPVVRKLLEASEGIGQVIDGEDGPTLGMPSPSEKDKMGDFILYPRPGYAIRDQAVGEEAAVAATNYAGTHGGRADDPDFDAIFIASGRGIKPGVQLPRMRNLDVAPTVAKLLGVTLADVDGRVLDEVLADAPRGQ
jgi:predicted AlkP superfamily pyrophosphatase or phosphodiesterase